MPRLAVLPLLVVGLLALVTVTVVAVRSDGSGCEDGVERVAAPFTPVPDERLAEVVRIDPGSAVGAPTWALVSEGGSTPRVVDVGAWTAVVTGDLVGRIAPDGEIPWALAVAGAVRTVSLDEGLLGLVQPSAFLTVDADGDVIGCHRLDGDSHAPAPDRSGGFATAHAPADAGGVEVVRHDDDGRVRWRSRLDDAPDGDVWFRSFERPRLFAADSVTVVGAAAPGGRSDTVVALDDRTGAVVWELGTEELGGGLVAVLGEADQLVHLAVVDGEDRVTVVAVESRSGVVRWSTEVPVERLAITFGTTTTIEDLIVVTTSTHVLGLDARTGETRWTVDGLASVGPWAEHGLVVLDDRPSSRLGLVGPDVVVDLVDGNRRAGLVEEPVGMGASTSDGVIVIGVEVDGATTAEQLVLGWDGDAIGE